MQRPDLPAKYLLWMVRLPLIIGLPFALQCHGRTSYEMNQPSRNTKYASKRDYIAATSPSARLRWTGQSSSSLRRLHSPISRGVGAETQFVRARRPFKPTWVARLPAPAVHDHLIVANLALGVA